MQPRNHEETKPNMCSLRVFVFSWQAFDRRMRKGEKSFGGWLMLAALLMAAGGVTTLAAKLQQGVDANTAEADGTTALHWAVREDDLELAGRLIRAGASAKAANRYGVTP